MKAGVWAGEGRRAMGISLNAIQMVSNEKGCA